MTICESCGLDKKVSAIEGYILCEECVEEIVKCSHCGKVLGTYSTLEDNFGKLSVPQLSLPSEILDLLFCNVDHLEEFLKRQKEDISDSGSESASSYEVIWRKLYNDLAITVQEELKEELGLDSDIIEKCDDGFDVVTILPTKEKAHDVESFIYGAYSVKGCARILDN